MSDPADPIPPGVCTAPGCACDRFKPHAAAPMYCRVKKCRHSVEFHHLDARILGPC